MTLTISELIRALENIKFRNPQAPVIIMESSGKSNAWGDPEGLDTPEPILSKVIHFGEMQGDHQVINHRMDPFAMRDIERPLEAVVLFTEHTAEALDI